MAESRPQNRILLWGHMRSTSTALYRAMTNADDTKGIFEPYLMPYRHGPYNEYKTDSTTGSHEENDSHSYESTRALLNNCFPEYKTIFVKEVAHHLSGRLNDAQFLPQQYSHTFIIRNPTKAVLSAYRLFKLNAFPGCSKYLPIGMNELYQVFQIVTEEFGQEPVVIDSDDLLENPECMLKEYCTRVGITFHNNMVYWEDITSADKEEYACGRWHELVFKNVMAAKSFTKKPKLNEDTVPEYNFNIGDLPQEALNDLEESKLYYNKLSAFKIKLEV